MAIPYPDWLPLAQKANKNRSSDVGFRTDQPAVGAPIYQKLTDDLKTTWTITWLFQRHEDRAFEQWLRSPNYLDNGNKWFSMPVNLGGSGVQTQELHFTADGYPKQTSDNNGVITWSATVISRGVINSDDDDSDIIVELPPIWWSWLDEIVNRDLPEYVVAPVVPDISPINLAMVALDSRVTFTRAGAASYVGSNGLIQQAAANQWPLEYLGGAGRTEPETTSANLLLQSSNISSTSWTKVSLVAVGGFLAPDGSSTALHVASNSTSGVHNISQSVVRNDSTNYVYSVFLKAAEQSICRIQLGLFAQQANPQAALVDLSSGTITAVVDQSRVGIKSVGNGWYRVWSLITTNTAGGSIAAQVYTADQTAPNYPSTHSGDGVSGILIWGAQIEQASQPSSYIQTTTSTVTRSAATATIPANGASAVKITYSTGETTNLPFGGASSIQIPAATKAWGTRYITLIEYLP